MKALFTIREVEVEVKVERPNRAPQLPATIWNFLRLRLRLRLRGRIGPLNYLQPSGTF
jgi:hypothetical protein